MKTSILHVALLVVIILLVLGASTVGLSQPRGADGFRQWNDNLRLKGMPHQMLDEMRKHNGHEATRSPLRKILSPQSQIYVIDTAIVRSTSDTTRHLYSFNASGKRTCDLTQKLTGDLWVTTLRNTNTYDANNNMLTNVYEQWWNNGQLMNAWRYMYTYDAYGHMLTASQENWSNGQWEIAWRSTLTYDANGNTLTDLYDTWLNGQLSGASRWTMTYDGSGNMLSAWHEDWSNGQWVNSSRQTGTYDVNGNELSFLVEEWANEQWVNIRRWTHTYDANGNVLTDLYETWLNGQLVEARRWTMTYDGSRNLLTSLGEQWSNGQWVNFSRGTYTYDASGNMLTDLGEQWSNGQWVNSSRYTYSYDAKGNVLTFWFEQWGNGQWRNVVRRTYTYDANGNMTTYLYEDLTGRYPTYRSTFTYDAGGNVTSVWHDGWVNSSWTPKDVVYSISDSAGNGYIYPPFYYLTLTRRLIVTGVLSEGKNVPEVYALFQNYPNPFNPSATIKYELPRGSMVRLSVYDILGREVAVLVDERKAAGNYDVLFDASGLSSGVYLYRLAAGEFVQTRKMVVVK